MKFRSFWILGCLAALLVVSGCEKGKDGGEAKESAADEAAKKSEEAVNKAKEEAKKAQEAAEAATKTATEAAKKAQENAAATAEKAKAEAAAKLADAEKAKAAAVEAARKEGADAAAQAAQAADEAKKKAEMDALLGKKDSVMQLAVDIGCLKKAETDAQKMITEEANILAAASMDQVAFVTALDGLKKADAEFGKKIDAAVGTCPSAEEILRAKVIGIQVFNTCLRQAKVKPDRLGELQAEMLASYELSADEFSKLRNQFKGEPWFKPSLDEGLKSCPPIAEEDLVTEKEQVAKKAKQPAKPKAPVLNFAMKGKAFGSANGNMNIRFVGSKITSGSASLGGKTMPLSGYKMKNGKITIQGKAGPDFIRGFGKFKDGQNKLVGNWNGTIDGKRRSGSFVLNR